ncbi:MAG TPA: hypothetical protein VEL79_00295 [Vicinamibacterales bacterium]|nr:hypothetical protein [Vicinamibacterales bacterium]
MERRRMSVDVASFESTRMRCGVSTKAKGGAALEHGCATSRTTLPAVAGVPGCSSRGPQHGRAEGGASSAGRGQHAIAA